VPVVARVRPTSQRARPPSSTECRSGSPPRGTAAAVHQPLDLITLPVPDPIKPRRPATTSTPCGHGWPSDRRAQGSCAGCGGAQRGPVGAAGIGFVGGQMVRSPAGPPPPTRAGHPHLVHQPDQLAGVGVLPRGQPRGQVAATPVADGVELGGQPTRDRPSACWRLAWIEVPPLRPRRRAGGPGPRWRRSGHPSPAHRQRRPRSARWPRPWPRFRRSASARTACRPSPLVRTARAGPATALRCARGTRCR
jgi:hypothetical protein